jgi:glycosyltransferase involved in cell wall biosynthesis
MRAYCERDSRIKYIRSEQRTNIDVDLNQAVLHASGEYIWTLSADDVLTPGWSSEVGRLIADYEADIYLLPAIHCTIDMQPFNRYDILRSPEGENSVWQLNGHDDLENYLSAVRTSEGLFSFCSACMVKREKFMLTDPLEGTNGTCWRYAARLISAAVAYPCLIIIAHSSLVRKRGDNDSFAARGVVHRLGIAICQWTRAIQQLRVPDVLKARMIKLAHSDISFLSMLFASQFTRSTEERQLYEECVRQRFADKKLSVRFARAVLLRVDRIGVTAPLFHMAKKVVQHLRRRFQQTKL